MRGQIKYRLDKGLGEWGLIAVVLLLGVVSFGLGRFSAIEDVAPLIAVSEAPQTADPQALAPGDLYVASRTGSVYYYPWCSGGEKIAPGNQVWFASETAAQKAGYAPSKSCKGLGSG